ncbi:restriction endonuclease subunit S [Desulfovibrio intestinalis]|uniref:Type I restriction enzyme S subunit n=1 Tax=Desulfovibrio intestinalis TaxID=58621 RepID=A0A7W8C2B7_9BACT|nr:type I restriction enzyme S subunit [Desulfovibrio intestinalis]
MSGAGKRWKPYSAYKDSGVEWLGQVPEGWEVGRVAFGYNIALGKMLQPSPNSEQNIVVPYYRAMNVQWEKIDSDLKVMWATPEEIKNFGVRQGDLLVCEGGEVGRAAIINFPIDEPTIIQNALHRVRAFENCHVRYLLRVLEHVASADWFSVLCNKSTIAHFTGEKFKALKCPLPPLPEQLAIATFLDQQCAQIDSLIEKKKRMLSLLDEKRRAVITQAVTRGLDPTVPMKDSGVEWLGMVPEEWEVRRFKFLASVYYGLSEPPEYHKQEGVRFIRATDLHAGKIFLETILYVDPNDIPRDKIFWLRGGDIIVVRSGAYTGDSAIVTKQLEGSIAGFDMILRCTEAVPQFIQWVLLSAYTKETQIDLQRMRAAQPHLNADQLKNCILLYPPLHEQQAIADYLDVQCTALDSQRKNLEKSIELLREYRASLITHAVTGKIDVRDVAPLQ